MAYLLGRSPLEFLALDHVDYMIEVAAIEAAYEFKEKYDKSLADYQAMKTIKFLGDAMRK
jgi:hypothetical protein